MADMMTFPDTFEEYEKYYGFTDTKEVYTNGARLIPSFRVEQWLDYNKIVRCENCRYRKMKRTKWRSEPYIYYKCELLEREVEDDDFCAWGEEK